MSDSRAVTWAMGICFVFTALIGLLLAEHAGWLGTDRPTSDAKAIDQVRAISRALEAYRTQHKSYPAYLSELLRPDEDNAGNPYLDGEDAITDPWGNPYRFDPSGPKNGGIKADVWAESPRGQIGNWPRHATGTASITTPGETTDPTEPPEKDAISIEY